MNDGNWPFKPDHITNDGPSARPDDVESLRFCSLSEEYRRTIIKRRMELKKLTGMGLISDDHLEGLQTTICVNLGNPTIIVEFSPEGEPVRTDSKLLFISMHEPCKIFRTYTDEKPCLECDNCYAKLFYKLSLGGDLVNQARKRFKDNSFISGNKEDGLYCEVVVSDSERPYLEYDCSLLGYRELISPIFFEENVVAVFFVGQLCMRERLSAILDQQKRVFDEPSCILLKHCPDKAQRRLFAEKIRDAHKEWVNNRPRKTLGYLTPNEVFYKRKKLTG